MAGQTFSLTSVRSGFTLIEIVIVLFILALLAMLAVPRYDQTMEKTRRVAAQHDLNLLRDAFCGAEGGYLADMETIPGFTPVNPLADERRFECLNLRVHNLFCPSNLQNRMELQVWRENHLELPISSYTYDEQAKRGWHGPYLQADGQWRQPAPRRVRVRHPRRWRKGGHVRPVFPGSAASPVPMNGGLIMTRPFSNGVSTGSTMWFPVQATTGLSASLRWRIRGAIPMSCRFPRRKPSRLRCVQRRRWTRHSPGCAGDTPASYRRVRTGFSPRRAISARGVKAIPSPRAAMTWFSF